jgi:hypothetical protein
MSDLYCLRCRKYAYRSHKCDILSLVPVTRRCRNLADKLYSMGIEPLSVGHFTQLVNGSTNKYIINVQLELRHSYPIDMLGSLPIKWRVYKETCSSDRTPLMIPILAYYETYCYDGVMTVDNRVQEIIDEFVQYLDDNYDADGIKSVLTLMYD